MKKEISFYQYQYVEKGNKYMQKAKEVAEKQSKDKSHKTGAVIVKDGEILSTGANGSQFHKTIGCPRKWIKAKSGTLYSICPGCSPKHHAEQTAIKNAKVLGKNVKNADLYLYGHWWCCHSCTEKMRENGIKNVYLLKDSDKLFKKK